VTGVKSNHSNLFISDKECALQLHTGFYLISHLISDNPMKVTIDPGSGFCFGVNRAIQTAEAELEAGNAVFCLGEMVHNQVQMDHMKAKGLKVITHADLPLMKGKTIMVRAHGEPPETFQQANELGIKVIDATCPIVTKLQQRINDSFVSGEMADAQIVIYGKSGHAEIAGLNGNAGNAAIIISSENDFVKIDFLKPVRLFSQTTMDAEGYQKIGEEIQHRMKQVGNADLVINKSVCRQVSGRSPALRTFAAENDVIIFIGGSNSANGAYLFGICKSINEKSYFVNNIDDIDPKWFKNAESVGVSGATSTPGWLLEQVAEHIKGL
jgi:4-hydroxy-3-methylbut-2-en-1-yl diphosphate reductase